MAKKGFAKGKKQRTGHKKGSRAVERKWRAEAGAAGKGSRDLFVRVPVNRRETRAGRKSFAASAEADVPQATINRNGGPVTVEIAFGQAQHGK